MGIQPSRTKTRIRTKKAEPVPYEVATPLSPAALLERSYEEAGVCCLPVTIAHYRNEALVGLYRRHVGRQCAPTMEALDIKAWRRERGLR